MTNTTSSNNGLHHIGLFSKDIDATLRFYEKGLGFSYRYGWKGATAHDQDRSFDFVLPGIMLDAGDGVLLEIFPREPDGATTEPTFPLNHIALCTDNIQSAYQNALAFGGTPHTFDLPDGPWNGSPVDITMRGEPAEQATIAFVCGPDGELVEFFESATL